MIRALLDAGADIEAGTGDVGTPLHYAARFNENLAVVRGAGGCRGRHRGKDRHEVLRPCILQQVQREPGGGPGAGGCGGRHRVEDQRGRYAPSLCGEIPTKYPRWWRWWMRGPTSRRGPAMSVRPCTMRRQFNDNLAVVRTLLDAGADHWSLSPLQLAMRFEATGAEQDVRRRCMVRPSSIMRRRFQREPGSGTGASGCRGRHRGEAMPLPPQIRMRRREAPARGADAPALCGGIQRESGGGTGAGGCGGRHPNARNGEGGTPLHIAA